MNSRSLRLIALLAGSSLPLGVLFILIGLSPTGSESKVTGLIILGASLIGFSAVAWIAWLAVRAVLESNAELASETAKRQAGSAVDNRYDE